MGDEEEIIERLDEFLMQVRPLDELPHSFDDTLIDKLVENITPNDAIIKHTLSLVNEEVFAKNGAVTAKILIRLVDKFLTLRVVDFDVRLLLRISTSLLRLPNHPSVWSDVLALLVNLIKRETEMGRIGELREDLKDIVKWILRRLPEESLSLFVRNRIEHLVFVLSQQFIDDFMNYITTLLSENLSPIIRESYHRILTHFLQIRPMNDAKFLEVFIDSVRLNVTMTEASIIFFNEVMKQLPLADVLPILLSSQWRLPCQRLNAIVLYMETINDLPNELLAALRVSPLLKLEHFVRVFRVHKNKKDMLSSLPEWISVVERIFSSPRPPIDLLPDLVHLFTAQFSCSIDEWMPILVLVLRNILNKTVVFVSLLSSYALSQLVDAKIPWEIIETKVRDGLMGNDWENRDSAVEIVMYSAKHDRQSPLCVHLDEIAEFVPKDGSPYVRASSLRCLDAHSHSLTRQLAHERLLNDSEPQPRLEAARVFRSIPVTSTDDWIFFIGNLTKLLGDADYEVRSEVVTVCDKWMKMGSDDEEMRKSMIDQLSQWTNDSEIGDHVKAVLSLPAETRKDPTMHLLIDMIQGLEMPDDDTIDCY